MYNENEENKFKNVIDELKNLKKIEAPVGFEQKLWNKINSANQTKQKSIWNSLSVKLVPAAAVAATIIILFTVIDNSAYEYQDPFMIEPQERTDLISYSIDDIEISEQDAFRSEEKIENESNVKFRKKETTAPEPVAGNEETLGRSGAFRDEDNTMKKTELLELASADSVAGTDSVEAYVTPPVSAPIQQNLNFRQVQLSEKEQQEVDQLKSKVKEPIRQNRKF